MPTINQEKAARKFKEVLEGKEDLDGAGILESIGYSKAIAKNPKMVFQSKGFQEALKKLGFSIEAADLVIAKILRTGKEENQIKASQEIYKRLSAYAPEKHVSINLEITNEERERARKALANID